MKEPRRSELRGKVISRVDRENLRPTEEQVQHLEEDRAYPREIVVEVR